MIDQSQKPKQRRRFVRFSLRTLVAFLTIGCVWLGWYGEQARKQRRAVEWVYDVGGYAYYDYERSASNAEPPGPAWLRRLVGIDFFAEVETVVLGGSGKQGIRDLCPLTDLTSLKILALHRPPANGLKSLGDLTNLKVLVVSGPSVKDLEPLSSHTDLHTLMLSNTSVNDVTPLARLQNLNWLVLDNTQVADVTPLARLQNLTRLELDNTQVADLTPLARLTSLRFLSATDTPVSRENYQMIKQALPQCQVIVEAFEPR